MCFFWQTFGSGNLKQVGVFLQRGILILLIFCFPCWAILIHTQTILLAVRQSPEVARWSISTLNIQTTGNTKYTCFNQTYIFSFFFFLFHLKSPRISQLYVEIFMPALPVSPIVWDPWFAFDLNIPVHDFIIWAPAGCLYVPAAGEVSPESGVFHNPIEMCAGVAERCCCS